ncbi:MAG: hypothetical protein ACLFSR_03915 [Halomonas sp.]
MDQALTLYHWEDDNAPPMGGDTSDVRQRRRVELLHQVLITGYGDQEAAGWEEIKSEQAEDGRLQYFVARQPWGNGIYLRIERGRDIVAARDVEHGGASETDLLAPWRAGLSSDGYAEPTGSRWFALAGERSFYLLYDRTPEGTGEPVTGDQERAACLWEGFADAQDLASHPDAGTACLVGGASERTQFLAYYNARSRAAPTQTDKSAAIEGYPHTPEPHYAALRAPLGRTGFGSDAARQARWEQATTLENRIILDRLLIEDGNGAPRGYLPNVRYMLTGFVREADAYSADDYPRLGEAVTIDGERYTFAAVGANADTVMGAPNNALLLFKEGAQ